MSRVFEDYDAIVEAACQAWQNLIPSIRSLTVEPGLAAAALIPNPDERDSAGDS
jgi:hypothetical protein